MNADRGATTDISRSSTANTAAAWLWVDHLRGGGTTPWAAWLAAARDADDPRRGDRLLPGAQQLELVRRLNEAGRPAAALVERVLVASAPGRGRQDLELLGAVEPLAFGPPPIDPATLSADDLVRVAVGLIAEDVVGAGDPPREPVKARRWRTRYRIAGDRWLADAMRTELVAQGRPPGGRGAVAAVVGTDLATMVAHDWLASCFSDGGADWTDYCAGMRRRDRLPRRVDLAATAGRWAPELGGPDQVRVVLDPARVAKVVGVRRLVVLPDVAADAAELARRTAGALGILVTPPRRTELMRTVLRPRLAGVPGPRPVVPPEHREWLEEQARLVQRGIRAGGYPVVGDLDALRPRWPDLPAHGLAADDRQPDRVLSLALSLLLDPATGGGVDP
ncbi:hypothetical protein [Nocardioides sp.]|uniref:hypothetical protein n=1 Tax=Nocardioides sp. TaxID=35761 RepID=UPI001A2611F7|nr:hypothetical protein [Nocardioides sp.]MBJ7358150.1 hypothetical protein [Nocardioides sp.]